MIKNNLINVLKKAKQVQEQLEFVQSELANLEIEGQAGGGMVIAKVNGKQELLSVKIEPEILKEDIEFVEDLIVSAVNQAMKRAVEESQKKMKSVSGGILNSLKDINLSELSS